MPDTFILHSFRRCPFAMRTRITLTVKGIPYTVIEERLRNWTDWMIEHVPDPRVPILRHNEDIIRESNEINRYLNRLVAEPPLIPEGQEERMQEWMDWCDTLLKPQIDLYKYGETPEVKNAAKRQVQDALTYLDQSLVDAWLFGEQMSLADIAIIPFVRQVTRVRPDEMDMSPYPNVVRWMESVTESDWFKQEVMRKYPFAKDV